MRSSLEAAVIRSAGKWGFSEVGRKSFSLYFSFLSLSWLMTICWVEASLNLCSAALVMHGTILGETCINIYSPPYRVSKVKYYQSPAWWVSEFYWGHLHEQEWFKVHLSVGDFSLKLKTWSSLRSLQAAEYVGKVSFPGNATGLIWEHTLWAVPYTSVGERGLVSLVCFRNLLKLLSCFLSKFNALPLQNETYHLVRNSCTTLAF